MKDIKLLMLSTVYLEKTVRAHGRLLFADFSYGVIHNVIKTLIASVIIMSALVYHLLACSLLFLIVNVHMFIQLFTCL